MLALWVAGVVQKGAVQGGGLLCGGSARSVIRGNRDAVKREGKEGRMEGHTMTESSPTGMVRVACRSRWWMKGPAEARSERVRWTRTGTCRGRRVAFEGKQYAISGRSAGAPAVNFPKRKGGPDHNMEGRRWANAR